jgi:PAS domain S-box-containing protein
MQQEEERKADKLEHDVFFTHTFDLLAIVGSDGYFKRLNPAFKHVLGYTEEELCARPLVEFLHPEDVAKTQRGIKTLAEGSPTIASVNRYRCKDGTYKWFSWNTIPVGPIFYTVGRNITDQMAMEEHIRQLNAELASKNEDLERRIQDRMADLMRSEAQVQQLQKLDAIGRLAGGIAHDFNNMLGAISLYCDMLMEEDASPEFVHEQAKDIMQVTTRGAALTRQLLIFSRQQIIQPQTIRLNPLIQQLEKMLSRLIGENIQIKMQLTEDLNDINADPSQMEQVLLNLVVNARDAMPRGGTIRIETSNVYLDETFTSTHLSVSPGHYVMLSVTDEGTGMDAATLTKIFDPFFTTKPAGKGTGLGLSTTYGIIKQSKGTIWAYSEPGKGTIFKIYLPIAYAKTQEVTATPARIMITPGSLTILLVEDDENLRGGFVMMLQKKGYKVLAASGGNEALQICGTHKEPIHLMLTDVIMAGMNGFEAAKIAMGMRPDMRVLYMSGYTSDALENSGIENTAQLNFIQKPFDTNTLVAKIQKVLFPEV